MTTTVDIITIICHKTQEAKDEVYLKFFVDEWQVQENWGVHIMDDGNERSIARRFAFHERFRAELWEKDPLNDYQIGTLDIQDTNTSGDVSYDINARRAEYTIVYTLNPVIEERYFFEPISLRCIDAQEIKDEPYLIVNALEIWGPVSMKTGELRTINIDAVPFSNGNHARVELWERDPNRSERLGVLNIDASLARTWADIPSEELQRWTFHRDSGIPGDATYELLFRVSRSEMFQFDFNTKRLTVSSHLVELSIEGGAIVYLRDVKSAEVFIDTTPWPNLEGSDEATNGFLSKNKNPEETNKYWRRPTVESAATFTLLSSNHGVLTYQHLLNDDYGRGRLVFNIAVDEVTGEILLRVSGFEGRSDLIPAAIDLPLLEIAKSAVILGNGIKHERSDPECENNSSHWDYGLYAPSVGVVEGDGSALAVWSENPEFTPDYIKLIHREPSDHLILRAGTDIEQSTEDQVHSPMWRIGLHENWTEAARRWRQLFEAWSGAQPLWRNPVHWVRDIHAVVGHITGKNEEEVEEYYRDLTDIVPARDARKLLVFIWNGNQIVQFGDHTLKPNGFPTTDEIKRIHDHGWRLLLYHPYDLIYSETGVCYWWNLMQEEQNWHPPLDYRFIPDYDGTPEHWHEHWVDVRARKDPYYYLHPGSQKFQKYFVRNVHHWVGKFGAAGCYFDTMGLDWARVSPSAHPEDLRIVIEEQSWVTGERNALRRLRTTTTTRDLAVMSEYASPWLSPYIFYTWAGAKDIEKFWKRHKDITESNPGTVPLQINHPLRTALIGSYVWTREDRDIPPEAVSLMGKTLTELNALLGTLPAIPLAVNEQTSKEQVRWGQDRAALFCEEELYNDLPPRWDPKALAYYRSRNGNWFKFVRLDPDTCAYKEELLDGTERKRLTSPKGPTEGKVKPGITFCREAR